MDGKSNRKQTLNRNAHIRITDNSLNVIEGYAAIYNQWDKVGDGFWEIIRPGCFTHSIITNNIYATWNFDGDLVLGNTKTKTLYIKEDDHGLWYELMPFDKPHIPDLCTLINKDIIIQAAIGFCATQDNWSFPIGGRRERELIIADLYELGFHAIHVHQKFL